MGSRQAAIPRDVDQRVIRGYRVTDRTRSSIHQARKCETPPTADALNTWAKQVAFDSQQSDELLAKIQDLYEKLNAAVALGQPDAIQVQTPTVDDLILTRLDSLLAGKVGAPPDDAEWKECVAEGKRRADASEPPGYLDADKSDSTLPEGPAGDYLVWRQACRASADRDLDLVIVTGDEKEDWWRRHQSHFLGPRVELVVELRQLCGHRLYMLRPTDLLAQSAVLDVTVRQESVKDAERARPDYAARPEWTANGVHELLRRLELEAPVQAETISVAAISGGEVDRDVVYEIGGYDTERMLRGFTRPVARVTAELQAAGIVLDGVAPMLVALYPDGVKASAFRVPPEVVQILQRESAVSYEES